MQRTIDCFYHEGCVDGLVAACLVKMFHPTDVVNLHPTNYGFSNLKEIEGRDLIFVDIAPPPKVIMSLLGGLDRLLILDHHASAQKEWLPYLPAVHNYENYHVRFDMEESGASLTWKYFKSQELPELIQQVRNYDMYQFDRNGKTQEVNAYLEMIVLDYHNTGNVNNLVSKISRAISGYGSHSPLGTAVAIQAGIIMQNNKTMALDLIRRCSSSIVLKDENGNTISYGVCNAPRFLRNQVADKLLLDNEVAFIYEDNIADGVCAWSVRSRKEIDLDPFYAAFGAGGHANAGGFRRDISQSGPVWLREQLFAPGIAQALVSCKTK